MSPSVRMGVLAFCIASAISKFIGKMHFDIE